MLQLEVNRSQCLFYIKEFHMQAGSLAKLEGELNKQWQWRFAMMLKP